MSEKKPGVMQPGVKTVAKRGPVMELTPAQMERALLRHVHPRRRRKANV